MQERRCAHQVCNFADCIKIASDFVSMENVGRCWQGAALFPSGFGDFSKLMSCPLQSRRSSGFRQRRAPRGALTSCS